jgi:predicted permease
MNSIAFLDRVRQDLLFTARNTRKNPAFAATAVLALALGIGANAAIFSVFYNVLLRSLPYRNSAELLSLGREMRGFPGGLAAAPEFAGWRADSHIFQGIAAWYDEEFNLTGPGTPERVQGADVTADFLSVLGTRPALGRGFTADDERPGAPAVALLTHELWQRRFGGDPSIVGRSLVMNDVPHRVAGVLPASFRFPASAVFEVLVPFQSPAKPSWTRPRIAVVAVIARPRAGVFTRRMIADLSAISERYRPQMPAFYADPAHPSRITAIPLHEQLAGRSRPVLVALLWSVGILLLLACVNVANLQLARAAVRQREIGLRAALGASRARLAQWLVTENMVLSGMAGLAGLALAYALLRILKASQGVSLPDPRDFDPGWMLWAVTLGLSILAGLLAGLLPALMSPKLQLNEVLKSGALSITGGRGARARSVLVLVQVALALVLLIGSGLLLRSLQHVLAVNWGFRPDRLLMVRMRLPASRYDTPAKRNAFCAALLERAGALPGVESVAISSALPLLGYGLAVSIVFEGQPVPPPSQRPSVPTLMVTPAYFRTMGTPLLAGRQFSPSDAPTSAPVAIVNAAFAKRFYPAGDAVGKRIQWGGRHDFTTIVGVAADIRQTGRESGVDPQVFIPETPNPTPRPNLILRARIDPGALAPAVRSAVWAVDKEEPVYGLKTMDQLIRESGASRSVETLLLASFGLLALALAAIGIYGVVSEMVNRKTREIGLRMALGAQAPDVLRMILRRSLALTLAGIAVGAGASFYLVRYLESLLFGIEPRDAVAFAGAGVLLLAVALVAAYLPARRAARIDPVVTLRSE